MKSVVINNFSFGAGNTGPVSDDMTQEKRADSLAQELSGPRFYVAADGKLVARCIDERSRHVLQAAAGSMMAPNAAGATMSLTVADMLTGSRITGGGTLLERHKQMVAHLVSGGLLAGGHEDDHDHAFDGGSGCGACDQLSGILAFMLGRLDGLVSLLSDLSGIEVDDDLKESIRTELNRLPEIAQGGEILEVLQAAPGDRVLIEQMIGTHDALAAVINLVDGTTLDRERLRQSLELSAFNIDGWAFRYSAETLYGKDERQVHAAVVALWLYNCATSAALCNNQMRIVVRR